MASVKPTSQILKKPKDPENVMFTATFSIGWWSWVGNWLAYSYQSLVSTTCDNSTTYANVLTKASHKSNV